MTKLNKKSELIGNLEISFWFDVGEGLWYTCIKQWKDDEWIVVESAQSLRKKLVEEIYNQNILWAEALLNKKEAVINHEETI